jgi:hypothetical protein
MSAPSPFAPGRPPHRGLPNRAIRLGLLSLASNPLHAHASPSRRLCLLLMPPRRLHLHLRAIRSTPVHTQPMRPLYGSSPNPRPPAGAATDVAYLPETLTSPPLMASPMLPSSAGSAPTQSRPLPFFSLCARKWAMRS